jgi:Domain of unknown function (DUF4383)
MKTKIQQAAFAVGVVFLVVGIAGFIPGLTEDAPGSFWGEDSEGSIFGVFQTSILHNLVHLLFGVAGIVLARSWGGARGFLVGGGVTYLLLFFVGILGVMDWLPADDTDDWLHLGLGAAMLGLGLLLGRDRDRRTYVVEDRPSGATNAIRNGRATGDRDRTVGARTR